MDDQPSVLIIARPAHLLNSLRVLVEASTLVKSIHLAADVRSIANLPAQAKPALVILAVEPDAGDTQTALDQIKKNWQRTPIIALVDGEREFPEVISAGAEAVLVKGIRASYLLHVVESLLPEI